MSVELYNLAEDPGERDDRVARSPDRTKSTQRQLESWLSSVVRRLNGGDHW